MKNSVFIKQTNNSEVKFYNAHLSRLNTEEKKNIQNFTKQYNQSQDCIIGAYNGNLEIVGAVTLLINQKPTYRSAEALFTVEKIYEESAVIDRLAKYTFLWGKTNNIENIQMYWFFENSALEVITKKLQGNKFNNSWATNTVSFNLNIPNFMTTFKNAFKDIAAVV